MKWKEKREYWQSLRGICILAVVLIHSLGGFDYTGSYDTEFIILRQIYKLCSSNICLYVWVFCSCRKNL